MRLIDADKIPPLPDMSDCAYEGSEYQTYKNGAEYGRGLVDDAPTIDPETLRSTAKCGVCEEGVRMTQLQEAIRDKITKYSDCCFMCTDTIKECDTCGITCILGDLNELQKLADNQDAVRPTAKWVEAPDEGADGSLEACSRCTGESDWIRVKDRPPKDHVTVFAYDSVCRNIYKAWFSYDLGEWFSEEYLPDFVNITHWMPLPEPPEVTP